MIPENVSSIGIAHQPAAALRAQSRSGLLPAPTPPDQHAVSVLDKPTRDTLLGRLLGALLDLDAERPDRRREALVVAYEQAELDHLVLAERRLSSTPGRLGERPCGEQPVADRQ